MLVNHAKTVTKSDYIFYVRSTSHLKRRDVLRRLVVCGKSVVAPKLKTYDKVRYARVIRVHDNSKWNIKLNESLSFVKAALSAGNKTETQRKILAGVNFLTLEDDPKFWFTVNVRPSQLNENAKM